MARQKAWLQPAVIITCAGCDRAAVEARHVLGQRRAQLGQAADVGVARRRRLRDDARQMIGQRRRRRIAGHRLAHVDQRLVLREGAPRDPALRLGDRRLGDAGEQRVDAVVGCGGGHDRFAVPFLSNRHPGQATKWRRAGTHTIHRHRGTAAWVPGRAALARDDMRGACEVECPSRLQLLDPLVQRQRVRVGQRFLVLDRAGRAPRRARRVPRSCRIWCGGCRRPGRSWPGRGAAWCWRGSAS